MNPTLLSAHDPLSMPHSRFPSRRSRPRALGWLPLGLLAYAFGTVALAPAFAADGQNGAVPIVVDGNAVARIVADTPAGAGKKITKGTQAAIRLLQFAAKRASGVELSVLELPDGAALPEGPVILVGGGARTREAGFSTEGFRREEFRVETKGDRVALFGDLDDSQERSSKFLTYYPTAYWAVAEVVAKQWGGRWLWPGDAGFVVAPQKSLSIAGIPGTFRPQLATRLFGLTPMGTKPNHVEPAVWDQVVSETEDWLRFHRVGSRENRYRSPHSFEDWWEKYAKTKPDLLAQPPAGEAMPANKPDRVKLRVGNPDVVATILEEWNAAGRPPEWAVGPNDGAFFCTAPESMAMDIPTGQDPSAVWKGEGKLSARYAKFYQRISHAMKAAGADVTLMGYAYGCYRDAPPAAAAIQMETPVVLGFVHGFDANAKSQWSGWKKTGAELFLRPNWLHSGAMAPYLRTEEMVDWLKWSIQDGSQAWRFDSLLGNWAAQGLNYYAIVRASEDPRLGYADILEEYVAGFGSAREPIRRYFQYWADYSKRAAYPVPAGGTYQIDPEGLYMKAVREHGIPENPVSGSYWASIFLYGDDVVSPARAILDEATAAAAGDSDDVQARVAFLRSGLDHLVLTRDTGLAALAAAKTPSPEADQRLLNLRTQLQILRTQLTPQHAVWGDLLDLAEKRSRSPVSGSAKPYDPSQDRGM